jgi:hydrogenase maturation protease
MRKDTVVLGLGNPLMSDEGVGVYLLERLSALSEGYPSVEFVDAGTAGMGILHLIRGRHKAVIVDCADMGVEPGRISKFSPEQVHSVKQLSHQSLHEGDLLRILDLARRLGQMPDEVVIFGIQPESTALGDRLSATLSRRTEDYLSLICEELDR